MSNRKKYLAIALMIGLVIGCGIGITIGRSDPPTPTLDPDVGIWDFLWVNSTVGVNTIEYYRNGQNYTAWIESISGGGVTDHGALTGLSDDDHNQYLFQDGSEELAGNWDAGNYGINASYFEASEFYLDSENKTDILAYPEMWASYVIFKEGATTYAKNGKTGMIDYTGTSWSSVIQSTIDATDHGLILIKEGTYLASSQVLIQDKGGIRIIGEGMYSTIIDAGSNGITIFNFSSSTSSHLASNSLSNLKLLAVGRPAGSTGIFLDSQNYFVLDDVHIQSYETGLHVGLGDAFYIHSKNLYGYACGVGAYFEGKISSSTFVSLFFQQSTGNGLTAGSSSTGVSFIAPTMEANGNDGMNIAIYSGLSIQGGFISDNGNDGIVVSGSGSYYSEGVEISGGYYSGNDGSNIRLDRVNGIRIGGILSKESTTAGLELSSNSRNVTVTGNTFLDTNPIILSSASDLKFINNRGFITENSGTATLLNGQTTKVISHGCSYTPNAGDISVHPIESLGSASFWYVDTITSTQFSIHVNADPGQDVDFAWSIDRH